MNEIIDSVGTLITIVVLVIAIILLPSIWVKVLAGLGLLHTMCAHDDYLKGISRSGDIPKDGGD